jgi:16S rRNA (cytidine1402-2'-O)-methyltransferase
VEGAVTDGVPGHAPGTLYVVSTPIGNLGDLSFRAVEVLRGVDLILAEDTRHTRHLLDRYEIRTSATAYHEHNEAKAAPRLLERLMAGESMAIVSDAGTPLLSDPGARLINAAIDAGLAVVPVPGASALLSALVTSGLDAIPFTFFGFLSRSGKSRSHTLTALAELRHTGVLYEAANRVVDTLTELQSRGCGDRPAVVAREMTKQFEEIRRGTVRTLQEYYTSVPPRGEVVIVLGGAVEAAPTDDLIRSRVRALRAAGVSARDAATTVAQELGVSRRVAYQMTQENE